MPDGPIISNEMLSSLKAPEITRVQAIDYARNMLTKRRSFYADFIQRDRAAAQQVSIDEQSIREKMDTKYGLKNVTELWVEEKQASDDALNALERGEMTLASRILCKDALSYIRTAHFIQEQIINNPEPQKLEGLKGAQKLELGEALRLVNISEALGK